MTVDTPETDEGPPRLTRALVLAMNVDAADTDEGPPRVTRVLVVVDGDETCSICGYSISGEASRWIGVTLAHPACAVDGDLSTRRGT